MGRMFDICTVFWTEKKTTKNRTEKMSWEHNITQQYYIYTYITTTSTMFLAAKQYWNKFSSCLSLSLFYGQVFSLFLSPTLFLSWIMQEFSSPPLSWLSHLIVDSHEFCSTRFMIFFNVLICYFTSRFSITSCVLTKTKWVKHFLMKILGAFNRISSTKR